MDMLAVIGIGLVGVALAVLLKQYKPEYSLAVSLIVGVLILGISAQALSPVLDELNALMESANLPHVYMEILVKSLGICFLTQIACDTCKDAGQSAIASKLEIAGKLAILALSLPLFSELISVITALLSV